ncbi:hypothetical protein VTI74DRAFT_1683 [Chaetomium olivicolor]
MSVRSGSSGSSSRRYGEYREVRIQDSKALKAIIYFCGRDPRKAKSIRRYYDEDLDARSTGSSGSVFSWSSGTSGVYLVETTNDYWYGDEPDATSYAPSKKRKSSKRGRTSRVSQHSSSSHPAGTWARHATVEDDDDDDDSSSDGSVDDNGGLGGAGPFPHPGMMPPRPGPPPGAFQPGYGFFPSPHATPHPMPPTGFPAPPPPPMQHIPTPQPGGFQPPPPPPGGHFVPGRGGIKVFVDG